MDTVRPGVNAFGDPRTGVIYHWAANHNEEQGGTRVRQIDNAQPTGARWRTVRSIRTQGQFDEAVLKLGGVCPTLAMHKMLLRVEDISQRQTVYFYHFAGEIFECQLSDYEPQRRYLQRGPKGEHYVWPYTMQIDVIGILP